MAIRVDYLQHPDERQVNEVARKLDRFNLDKMRLPVDERVVSLATSDDGKLVGGAIAYAQWHYLSLEVLWVEASLRGQGVGRRLMEAVEEEGKRRGCHSAHTDTFTFQAPAFYLGLGYRVFGTLEGYANAQTRYFLVKPLT